MHSFQNESLSNLGYFFLPSPLITSLLLDKNKLTSHPYVYMVHKETISHVSDVSAGLESKALKALSSRLSFKDVYIIVSILGTKCLPLSGAKSCLLLTVMG